VQGTQDRRDSTFAAAPPVTPKPEVRRPGVQVLFGLELELKPERLERLKSSVREEEAQRQRHPCRVSEGQPGRGLRASVLGAATFAGGLAAERRSRPSGKDEVPVLAVHVAHHGLLQPNERVGHGIRPRREEEEQGTLQAQPDGLPVPARSPGPSGRCLLVQRARGLAQYGLRQAGASVLAAREERRLVALEAAARYGGPAL